MGRYLERLVNLLKSIPQRIDHLPIDHPDHLKGGDSMIPPESDNFVGGGDFEIIGQEFKRYFTELANLRPNDKVLDIGCGIGRMAIPLTSYLGEGRYWGFDTVKRGIEWCDSHISPKFNNFQFRHVDIYNKTYNRKGRIRACDFQFPFDRGFFDFVFVISVFTHMLPQDVENYLGEISRVLKTGGTCVTTFFILNRESINLLRSGESTLDFKYEVQGCLTTNETIPEAAIAYDQALIEKLFEKYGLGITPPIHYGSWCKRSNFLTYQDLIISRKSN